MKPIPTALIYLGTTLAATFCPLVAAGWLLGLTTSPHGFVFLVLAVAPLLLWLNAYLLWRPFYSKQNVTRAKSAN
ncbi:MAG: hypothetical protein V4671_12770 [Armatimonadota bacterium]